MSRENENANCCWVSQGCQQGKNEPRPHKTTQSGWKMIALIHAMIYCTLGSDSSKKRRREATKRSTEDNTGGMTSALHILGVLEQAKKKINLPSFVPSRRLEVRLNGSLWATDGTGILGA